mmetsp:Transcript_10843/g.12390  ORF Transcript_10843/g.12390 Transcript_10843/m.12390 type:complete len:100 (+) Transcript_10843:229-528(+)|eukprot:CAMPEP_0184006126 /NCGR_PEP_ID=MMETSP0954-20121128/484_1 /TAXON_ID=627963 /ORGANISM="Aplanochytrium sp, Strain PBS07" /LENGTH=99 /DNA_ID=CAMNT_0026284569 /DNA_START=209 /DNA_END=508 /DNA_ORIENTATION=+
MSTVEELLQLSPADLQAKFDEVVKMVKEGPAQPSTSTADKLLFYGLYKQATEGDNKSAKPWAVKVEAYAKWSAWSKHKGKSNDQAKAEYVAAVMERMDV